MLHLPTPTSLTSEKYLASAAYGSGWGGGGGLPAAAPFPLAEPLVALATGRPPATMEAADMPAVFAAVAEATAAAALAAGGGRRAGAFILGHATPARLKEIMVHESWSKALG